MINRFTGWCQDEAVNPYLKAFVYIMMFMLAIFIVSCGIAAAIVVLDLLPPVVEFVVVVVTVLGVLTYALGSLIKGSYVQRLNHEQN